MTEFGLVFELKSPDGDFADTYFDSYEELIRYLENLGDTGRFPFVVDYALKAVE